MHPAPALSGRARPHMASSPLSSLTGGAIGQHPVEQPLFSDKRYRQVRAFAQLVDEQYRTQKTVRAYAEQLSLSPNHLNALCRRHQTASDVLHARIVAEAQQLLARSENSVAVIAEALGFDDASYFCRYFKKYVRQTPLAFRQAMKPA